MEVLVERYVFRSELEKEGTMAAGEVFCDSSEVIGWSGGVYATEFWMAGGFSPYVTCFLFDLAVEGLFEGGFADRECYRGGWDCDLCSGGTLGAGVGLTTPPLLPSLRVRLLPRFLGCQCVLLPSGW